MFKHEIHENHFMETLPRIKGTQRRLKQAQEEGDMDRLHDGQERRAIAKRKMLAEIELFDLRLLYLVVFWLFLVSRVRVKPHIYSEFDQNTARIEEILGVQLDLDSLFCHGLKD